jgi:hypothetical protein
MRISVRKTPWFVAAVCPLLPGILWLACIPESPINKANYHKIELGMTENQVIELLGPPGVDQSIWAKAYPDNWTLVGRLMASIWTDNWLVWQHGGQRIWVRLDHYGVVVVKEYEDRDGHRLRQEGIDD